MIVDKCLDVLVGSENATDTVGDACPANSCKLSFRFQRHPVDWITLAHQLASAGSSCWHGLLSSACVL